MGEQFSLKGDTVRLAREVAGARGQSITATIRAALEREEALIQREREQYIAEVRAMAADFRAQLPPELLKLTSKEWMDAIYDEDGLPEGS